jgi:hypothetical protein
MGIVCKEEQIIEESFTVIFIEPGKGVSIARGNLFQAFGVFLNVLWRNDYIEFSRIHFLAISRSLLAVRKYRPRSAERSTKSTTLALPDVHTGMI